MSPALQQLILETAQKMRRELSTEDVEAIAEAVAEDVLAHLKSRAGSASRLQVEQNIRRAIRARLGRRRR